MSLWYDKFFRAATGFEQPFGYRGRLACGDNVRLENPETLVQGRECLGVVAEIIRRARPSFGDVVLDFAQ